MLTAKALKVTTVLNAAELVALPEPTTQRVVLKIAVAGRVVTCDVAAKAFRKARALIAAHGVENVAVLVQGKLEAGDKLGEAGLVAQPKTAKPAANGDTPAATG